MSKHVPEGTAAANAALDTTTRSLATRPRGLEVRHLDEIE